MPIGYAFQPGSESLRLNQPGGGGGVSGLSPQEAVKFLSLRLPERPSANAIAPQMLLQSPGSMGMMRGGGDQSLNAVIQGLLQLFGQGGGGSAPPPRVRPIEPPNDFPGRGPVTPLPPPTGTIPRDFPPRGDGRIEPLPPPNIPRDTSPRGTPPLEPFPPGGFPAPDEGGFPNEFPDPNMPFPPDTPFPDQAPPFDLMGNGGGPRQMVMRKMQNFAPPLF